ncbi:MAG: hypothetical protein SFZ23_15980 [Planctomycetota bacterium]|nr:hypothetical protein [Planctomycetota bacterium]
MTSSDAPSKRRGDAGVAPAFDARFEADQLQRLRAWRNWNDPATRVDEVLQTLHRDLLARRRALRGADQAWTSHVPPELRDRFELIALRSGSLEVRPLDSAAGYELDRWLRAQGARLLLDASRGTIKRVRVVVERRD